MKMKLDGSINNEENYKEISKKKFEKIIKEYPNFGNIYSIKSEVYSAVNNWI